MALWKTPKGRWRAAYRDEAGRQRSKTFDTKTAGRAWLAEQQARLQRGEHFDPHAGRRKLGDFAADWLAHRVVEKTTAANDASRWKTHVEPYWAPVPLERIRTSTVQAWITRMSRDGLSSWTIRSAYNLLSGCLDAAVKDRIIASNPCKGVDLPRRPEGRRVYLTRAEVDQVAEKMAGPREDFDRAVLYTLAYTGMRWGELVGLTLPRVDLMRQRIEVVETIVEVDGRFSPKPYPKGGRRRTVPIPDPLVPVLAEHLRRWPVVEDELGALVFRPASLGWPLGRGKALSRHHWRRSVFAPAVEAALGRTDVHVHDLRHSFASWLVQDNISLYKVQALLGHADAASTTRYAHLVDDDVAESLASLSKDVRHALREAE